MRESFLQPADPWRPQYHYSPWANWMNDPNGMVYFNGEYHLMYQYFPGGQTWGPMHWGHAVSRDLMHWEHRPVALYPDEFGMIFSGSAVVDWRDSSGFFGGKPGLVAVFTHHAALPDTREVRQSQSLAYSADGGRTWVKHKGNPVLTEPSLPDFRDPKVFWHGPENRWIMLLAAGDHIRFYASPNLREWTYTGEFGRREGSHQGVWECPDVFPLPVEGQPGETRWVLLVSIGGAPEDEEGSRTQYFLGTFRDGCFHGGEPAETVRWLDAGRDHYAGVTWSDAPDNRRILLGWMSNWKYAAVTPAASFRGAMTLPRELSLYASGGEVRLRQLPVAEAAGLREETATWHRVQASPGTPFRPGFEAALLELSLEWDWAGEPGEAGVRLWTRDGQETRIGIDAQAGMLYIDRTVSGETGFHPAFPCRHETPLPPSASRPKLRIWADRISVEVFAGDGDPAMTDLIFPAPGPYWVEIYAVHTPVNIHTLELHRLRSTVADEGPAFQHGCEP
ncbi:glycoside hydrolase family 32 protein [Paenibacillus mesotrionivorans]|uniref:Glycoside hydrolase family 32 protein n=1 Tax=Paenibacillus mesotrionivorans TaxID=3160968 RepID=A0ACC7NZH6_9BACL